MSKVLTMGEPMVMFVAQEKGPLKKVKDYRKYIAGAEINVAVGLARLGFDVEYVTQLGQDPFGEYIYDFLKEEEIQTSYIQYNESFPTGFQIKNKEDIGDPEVVYFRKGSAASKLSFDLLHEIDFTDVDVFHVTGIMMALNEELFELTCALIDKAKEQQTLVTFDPNLRPVLWPSQKKMVESINMVAKKVDVILPGIKEGEILTNTTKKEEIADFYLELGVDKVIIKNGESGAYAKIREDGKLKEIEIPAFVVKKVVDTVGAGDGFAVGVISGLIEGLVEEDILERANAIGAIQVSHISDNENLPTKDELEQYISESNRQEAI
jgi:2-dehydro-3-deoxygluconokinase